MNKKCSKCEIEKICGGENSGFSKDRGGRDGFQYKCKSCEKLYRDEHREEMKNYIKIWREANSEAVKECQRVYYETHRDKNREHDNEISKIYAMAHKQEMRGRLIIWRKDNPEKVKEQQKRSDKKRLSVPERRLVHNASSQVRHILNSLGINKSGRRHQEFIGCSDVELQAWVFSHLTEGMMPANDGVIKWDIDHIIPISAWDLSNPKHLKACLHWTNLQPLERFENRHIKGGADKYSSGHFATAIAERLMVLRALDFI